MTIQQYNESSRHTAGVKRSKGTKIDFTILLSEVLRFLRKMEIESDEDSCIGMAFVTSRVNEDWYYNLMCKIEKALSAHQPDTRQETNERTMNNDHTAVQ